MRSQFGLVENPECIARFLQGDESAFRELVSTYRTAVRSTAIRFLGNDSEVEDAVQEVFLRVYLALRHFDPMYPFVPWIKRITSNYCIDLLRRRKARPLRLWSELDEGEQECLLNSASHQQWAGPLVVQISQVHKRIAFGLLMQLKPENRIALMLREVEGWQYGDIARKLGVPESGIRVSVSRARSKVRREFRFRIETLEATENRRRND
jgi:RNA polymerase sigma-70 factor, ECF subfamily